MRVNKDTPPADLLPCPCCGGAAWFDKVWERGNYIEFGGAPRAFWSVRCSKCDLRTPAIANPNSPVEKWNERGAPWKSLIAAIEREGFEVLSTLDGSSFAVRRKEGR
jgi:hypothetical protein